MSLVQVAFLLVTFNFLEFCESTANSNPFEPEMKRQPYMIKACGTPLADILSSVCGGVYNGKKRSNMMDNMIPDSDDGYNLDTYPEYEPTYLFRSKRNAYSLLRSMKSKRRPGLVEECCHKSCTLDELKGYCGSLFGN